MFNFFLMVEMGSYRKQEQKQVCCRDGFNYHSNFFKCHMALLNIMKRLLLSNEPALQTASLILGTVRSEDEEDYKNEFSVLNDAH